MVAAMGPLFSNLTSLIFVDPNELIDAEVFHDSTFQNMMVLN